MDNAPTIARVLAVAGTRPEVIKLAPLAQAFGRLDGSARFDLLAIAQQGGILERALAEWGLSPSERFAFGRGNGSPAPELVGDLARAIRRLEPDWVVVQGDTTSALAGALAAARAEVPCAHVEAGLRTGDLSDPYPEEPNRIRIAQLSRRHYAPTESAKRNLLAEGYGAGTIRVVGNTGIDALMQSVSANGETRPTGGIPRRRRILVTGHRRENHGAGLERICVALEKICALHPDVQVDFVLHPNPRAHRAPIARLSTHPCIRLTSPLGHREFVSLLSRAYVVLTDSGGLQEEAPYLGIPVLVTRERTERPEVVSSGNALLVGSDVERIVAALSELLSDPTAHAAMARVTAPYGDGNSGGRIRDDLIRFSSWRSSTTR